MYVMLAFRLLFISSLVIFSDGKNVLLFSSVGSHCTVMSIIAEELYNRGYGVTMVSPSFCCTQMEYRYKTISYHIGVPEDSYVTKSHKERFRPTTMAKVITEGLFKNSQYILNGLNDQEFDIAIIDSAILEALTVVASLDIPHIIVSCSRFEPHLAQFSEVTLPMAYIPVGDKYDELFPRIRSFFQRATNYWTYLYQSMAFKAARLKLKRLRDTHLPEMSGYDLDTALRNTVMWIINADYNIEFPYPMMQNVKFVGSITAQPAVPVVEELERFVNDSGDSGIIVVSFSTLFPSVGADINAKFLEALEALPHRVVWRGESVQTESNKTKFMKWIPQNDLLGSPKTRLLITNGGMNAIQEAMYHGVPLVVLPIFDDQPAYATRVEAFGYGIRLELSDLTPSYILKALISVLYQKGYAEKMRSVSEMIHHEHSLGSGRDTTGYWIEHAIKFRQNYISQSTIELNFFQVHSIDIISFCLGVPLLVMYVIIKCSKMCRKRGLSN